jgi:hypothetical protein
MSEDVVVLGQIARDLVLVLETAGQMGGIPVSQNHEGLQSRKHGMAQR